MALDTSRPVMQSIGSYDLIEKVAEGGMGSVYRAKHRITGQIVAIKIMPPHMAGNPVLLKRFEQEFRAASLLDHPNIVRAIEYQDNVSAPYLVMEFVEGESLGQKIERDGRMSETESIRIIAQVAQGLHRAHKQGMIHRDVKPDNVMVTPEGQAKLADLGLVKEVEADLNLTRTGRGLGTPHFMAPEQFRNAKNADVRCDIYALGATLYMMVTGELPFRSNGPLDAWMKKIHNELTPPRDIVPDLSERVDWAIRRAMSAETNKRPNTCREFIEDLTGHSTRRITPAENSGQSQDLWYLVYKDEIGSTHTVKGTHSAIRRSLKEGLLGDASNVRASRLKTGPFDPVRSYPEFRDLVAAPGAVDSPSSTRVTPMPVNDSKLRHRPKPPSTPSGPPAGPHIDMDVRVAAETSPQTVEGILWLAILLVVALATAFVGYFWLLPNL
jgi:serine/threonine protein kinase